MRALLFTVSTAAIALAGGLATPAHAVVCSGTTTVASGDTVSAAALLGTGACVAAGDKVFGEFSASGAITGNGSGSFTFAMTPGNVTLGFSGVVGVNSVGGIDYSVAVDPALSQGFLIDDLEKDITFNASNTALPASVTLTGTVNPGAVAFLCTRTIPAGGDCPVAHTFAPVMQISVNQTIATDANAIVTGLTDTISQVAPVSEPRSLALLGTAILGFGVSYRWMRRRRNDDDTGSRAAA